MQELWTHGYTVDEQDEVKGAADFTFRPIHIALRLDRRPVEEWDRRNDDAEIRGALARPLDGLRLT